LADISFDFMIFYNGKISTPYIHCKLKNSYVKKSSFSSPGTYFQIVV